MKTKSWKKYMCLMGISLMMMPAVCAMQTAEGGNADNPVKKTRSTTFISGEKAWEPAGEGPHLSVTFLIMIIYFRQPRLFLRLCSLDKVLYPFV